MNEDNELKIGVSAMLWLLNSLQVVVSRPRRLCTRKTQPRGVAALLLVSATLPAERARASLRTALWRIRQVCPVLVSSDSITVTLADSVWVDVYHFRFVAEHLLAGNAELGPNHLRLIRCAVELLPGWDEDWLILAREQLRQLRLHALEASARRMLHRGQYSDAIDTMLAVVAEEPLRESAQSALIEAHLAEGNIAEAHRQCAAYSEQLWTELQLRPSSELLRRVGLTAPPPRLRMHEQPQSRPAAD